MKRKAFLTGEV